LPSKLKVNGAGNGLKLELYRGFIDALKEPGNKKIELICSTLLAVEYKIYLNSVDAGIGG
jgi:hypothetical protein